MGNSSGVYAAHKLWAQNTYKPLLSAFAEHSSPRCQGGSSVIGSGLMFLEFMVLNLELYIDAEHLGFSVIFILKKWQEATGF